MEKSLYLQILRLIQTYLKPVVTSCIAPLDSRANPSVLSVFILYLAFYLLMFKEIERLINDVFMPILRAIFVLFSGDQLFYGGGSRNAWKKLQTKNVVECTRTGRVRSNNLSGD